MGSRRSPQRSVDDGLTPLLRQRVRRWLRGWALLWGDAERLADVSIVVGPRLQKTWARAYPRTRRLVLSPAALNLSPPALRSVVCHEAAHLFMKGGAPHGVAWRRLVEAAGEAPTVALPDPRAPRSGGASAVWLHRCPVCQMTRVARRPISRWRCAVCVAAGLPGGLVVERVREVA